MYGSTNHATLWDCSVAHLAMEVQWLCDHLSMKRTQLQYGVTDVYAFCNVSATGFDHDYSYDWCWFHFYVNQAAVPEILYKYFYDRTMYCSMCDEEDMNNMLGDYGYTGCIKDLPRESETDGKPYEIDRKVREWARTQDLLKTRPWNTTQKKINGAIKYLIATFDEYEPGYFYNEWGFRSLYKNKFNPE